MPISLSLVKMVIYPTFVNSLGTNGVKYREHTAGFPLQRETLGRVLGPAKGEGNEVAQWILKAN